MDKIIDIHCHVDGGNSNDYVRRAYAAGVIGALWNAAMSDDWDDIILATRDNDFLGGAIGVHPWYIGDAPADWESQLIKKLTENPDLQVGEIGLDKHYPDMDTQMNVFVRQIQIAHQLHRTVQVHCVGAWERVLQVLSQMRDILPPAIVMHSYNAGVEITTDLMRYDNVYVSYGPRIMSAAARVLDAIVLVPGTRLLVESDSDNPADARRVLAFIARTRGENVDKLASQIYENSLMVINNGNIA